MATLKRLKPGVYTVMVGEKKKMVGCVHLTATGWLATARPTRDVYVHCATLAEAVECLTKHVVESA